MYGLDSDPVVEELSSSLFVEAARLLEVGVRNSRQKPKVRRWIFEEKALALALIKHSPKSYIILQVLFPLSFR
jgi:hypothetical protein